MTFLKAIKEKPWQSLSNEHGQPVSVKLKISAPQLALRVLIIVISILFLLFTITFISRTQLGDFQALAGEPWLPLDDRSGLWRNTGLLLLASFAMHWAKREITQQKIYSTLFALGLAVIFSLLFLVGQFWIWLDLIARGYYVYSNPANSYYYLFTGVHGLHLLGGMIAMIWVVSLFWRNVASSKVQMGIRLCTHYWHFLFIVWLGLFAMLTSSAETFSVIARLCGF